jgi:hypothetical protein
MSDYNLCHGPECHKKHTQDRVRGVKGSKVLRTRKVKPNSWTEGKWWSYFCSNSCYNDFSNTYLQQIIAIAPRTECLETPILNPERKTHTYHYGFNNEHSYNRIETKIEVDETRSTDVG